VFFCSTLALVKNHINEWNTFTSCFIDWKVLKFICYYIYLFINLFYFIISTYLEIEFIKPLDDVKIQRKIIIFTKDEECRTVFTNKND
jgi:Na+/H+ antiporter NhaC